MLTVGSLFAGIGGFDLGFERAGMRTLWFCEQDEFCQQVLAKRWPGVPCYPDVRNMYGSGFGDHGGEPLPLGDPVPPVDVLCGGFPCQDISVAGKAAGLSGARSGLWSEFARLIGELGPRYVVVENVSALLARGMGTVLGDLAALGYDAEWDCIPASAVGAPHQRDRIWIVAYPARDAEEGVRAPAGAEWERVGPSGESGGAGARGSGDLADAGRERGELRGDPGDVLCAPGEAEGEGVQRERGGSAIGDRCSGGTGLAMVADPPVERLEGLRPVPGQQALAEPRHRGALAYADSEGSSHVREGEAGCEVGGGDGWRDAAGDGGEPGWSPGEWWATEPDVGRVAHGIPMRVDRLRSLGNALVPQIAEWIGRRIIDYENGA